MSWLASLFGGGKTTDKIVDSVINGVDAVFYTDQEKAEANQKILDWKLEWLKATQGQNIARRVIAFGVGGMWLACGIVVLVAQGCGFTEFSKFAFDFMVNVVSNPFMLIMTFYYAAHVVRQQK